MGAFSRFIRIALMNLLNNNNFNLFNKKNNHNFNYYYNKYNEYYKKYNTKKESYNNKNEDYKKRTSSKIPPERTQIAQYYANLEVPYGSSLEKVRKSWKKLLKKYHPDMHQDHLKKKKATILTQKLNEAYFSIEKYLKTKTK